MFTVFKNVNKSVCILDDTTGSGSKQRDACGNLWGDFSYFLIKII